MSDPDPVIDGTIVGDDLPAVRPLPPRPASAGGGLTSTLAALPPGTARAVVEHSAAVARELRAVIDNVKGPDGKPTLVAVFKDKRGNTHEHLTAEAWAMMGAMVGVGCRVETSRPVDYSSPRRPKALGWETMAVAFDRASGEDLAAEWGICLRDEQRWSDAAEYAVRGMSATRARGRAYRAALGYVAHLAGYDPTPAEERGSDDGETGAAFPEGAQRPTASQEKAVETRIAKLDLDRAGDVPQPFGGWRDYLDAFLARRLRGRGLAGLTRPENERLRERLDDLIGGAAPEPVEPQTSGATPPPASATGAGRPEPAPVADPPQSASAAEGKVRAAQVRRLARERGLDDDGLEPLLAVEGVRLDELAHDLALDTDRYRRVVEAVTTWTGGPSEDAAGEPATPARPGGESPADPEAAATGSSAASGGECPACGEASEDGALCAECAAMGLGS